MDERLLTETFSKIKKQYNAIQNRAEGFLSGNRMLRGEKSKNKSKNKKLPAFANMYFTGFGVLLVYLMYRMMHKK